jgi:hypothetical protein
MIDLIDQMKCLLLIQDVGFSSWIVPQARDPLQLIPARKIASHAPTPSHPTTKLRGFLTNGVRYLPFAASSKLSNILMFQVVHQSYRKSELYTRVMWERIIAEENVLVIESTGSSVDGL